MEKSRDRYRRRPSNRVNSKQRKDNKGKEENKDTEEFEIIDTRHYFFKGLEHEVKYLGGSNFGKYIKTLKKGNVLECQLFYKGILLSSWSEVNGKHIGKEVTYERGIVSSVIDNDKSFKNTQRCIENQKQGPALTIYDETTEKMIYRGDFNSNYERHGKGAEFYAKTGNVKLVGIWESDKLRQVVKEFEDDEMIEYADGHDNLDVYRRIPLYIGGYTYDEENDEYVRHGAGCILDRYGKAIHEGVWENGEEKSGIDLYDGWYEDGAEAQYIQNVQGGDDENDTTSVYSEIDKSSTQLEIRSKEDIRGVNFHIRELIVYPSFNGYVLKLYNLKSLKTIEIGDSCLQNVSSFSLSNLPGLVSVKIGKNCSEKNCSVKNVKMMKNKLKLSTNKSFSIQNCRHLKLIEVGEGSFIDFGRFEITNCQKLEALSIGSEKDSWNFFAASFIIQNLESLKTIFLGDSAFRMSTETCIENLPQLRTISLKANALLGNNTDSSTLSLTDLPALESLVAEKNSFYFPRTISLSNISKKAKFTLPGAFKKVITNSIGNIPGSLQRLIRDAVEEQSAMR